MFKSQKIRLTLFFIVVFFVTEVRSQRLVDQRETPVKYHAGYQNLRLDFEGREVDPRYRSDLSAEFDIWYPANIQRRDKSLRFDFFLNRHESRLKKLYPEESWRGFRAEANIYWQKVVGCKFPYGQYGYTQSYSNARKAYGDFPLIIYFTSRHQISYKNIGLFEYLSRRGYMVAVVNSEQKINEPSIESITSDLNDARLLINHFLNHQEVDSSKIAALGVGQGGLVALSSAMLIEEIDALISINGEEINYYNRYSQNPIFDSLRQSSFFRPEKIATPYFHIADNQSLQYLMQVDSIYNSIPELSGSNYYLRLRDWSEGSFDAALTSGKNASQPVTVLLGNFIIGFLRCTLANPKRDFTTVVENYVLNSNGEAALFLPQTNYDAYEIRARVVDRANRKSIKFPKIELSSKALGTLGNEAGYFKFNYLDEHADDYIKISVPGFKTKTLSLQKLFDQERDSSNIYLERDTGIENNQNQQVPTQKSDILTTGKSSEFFTTHFPKSPGTEIVTLINVEKPLLLKGIEVSLASDSNSEAIFRINIYENKQHKPGKNIMPYNGILSYNSLTNTYFLAFDQPVLINNNNIWLALELLDMGSDDTDLIFKSVINEQCTYVRNLGAEEWESFKQLAPEFKLEIEQITDQN